MGIRAIEAVVVQVWDTKGEYECHQVAAASNFFVPLVVDDLRSRQNSRAEIVDGFLGRHQLVGVETP